MEQCGNISLKFSAVLQAATDHPFMLIAVTHTHARERARTHPRAHQEHCQNVESAALLKLSESNKPFGWTH